MQMSHNMMSTAQVACLWAQFWFKRSNKCMSKSQLLPRHRNFKNYGCLWNNCM